MFGVSAEWQAAKPLYRGMLQNKITDA